MSTNNNSPFHKKILNIEINLQNSKIQDLYEYICLTIKILLQIITKIIAFICY